MSTAVRLWIDPERLRKLFDLSGEVYATRGGSFEVDPYPVFNARREEAPVHEGIPGPMIGFHGEAVFEGLPYPDRPHFTAFDYQTCRQVLLDTGTYMSSPHEPGSEALLHEQTMLYMDGARHRRYRALVQSSFVSRRMDWWIERWVRPTVDELIDLIAPKRRADLNLELCALVPLLTICRSFGISTADTLDIRAAATSDGTGIERFTQIVLPLIAARRAEPQDDLISVLVRAELTEEDGRHHTLSDAEVLGFAFLLLTAGSGTTWKQMGITIDALLDHPEWLVRIREDEEVLDDIIEESLRWMPTDPVFARFATKDVVLHGVSIPKGSVVHLCFASANRDPVRWEKPDEFDPGRPKRRHLGFGVGAHACLGMELARTEIRHAIAALVQRLPGLRPDPDAEPPRMVGVYERGPTSVPVIWD
ncbi:MAG: cytochrome P450 [Deltaproteobacteria bacterium]|jgi:cytochrome P450|nr:cytochrome P450 [Deltaproteobacteria bacterium]